jgi:arylsulfatase A-like enzyme
MVVFSSDNGPWLIFDDHGGSAGLLKEGKGSTWEGGMRVPGIFWWPGRIPSGVIQHNVASTMDLLPTCAALCEAESPMNVLDGVDLSDVLLNNKPLDRQPYFYYRGSQLFACRVGPWKMHLKTQAGYGQKEPESHVPPLLFHVEIDPGEKRNIAEQHPDVVKQVLEAIRQHSSTIEIGPTQLESSILNKG